MHDFVTVLLIIAAAFFAAAAIGYKSRLNFMALGLLAWVLAVLVPRF